MREALWLEPVSNSGDRLKDGYSVRVELVETIFIFRDFFRTLRRAQGERRKKKAPQAILR
jgi:hypothetical protein